MAKAALYRKRIELVLLPLLLLLLAVTFSGCQAESNHEDLLLYEVPGELQAACIAG